MIICWCHVYHDMVGVAWCSRMEQVGASVHKFQEAPALSALAGQNWLPRGPPHTEAREGVEWHAEGKENNAQ